MRPLFLLLLCAGLGPCAAAHSRTRTPAPACGCDQNQCGCGDQCGCKQCVPSAREKTSSTEPSKSAEAAPGIQDNSFLVEEAYNQEFGVVQHIQTFQRMWNSKDWAYAFTQEWPFDPRPRHQLSYTLGVLHSGSHPESGSGLGDLILNYRYQLLGGGKEKVAFSPRISLMFPTGSTRAGRGVGGVGYQMALPLSWVLSEKVVTHWNLGATMLPVAHNDSGSKAATFGYNFGQSVVWLARPRVNFLLETVVTRFQTVTSPDTTTWNTVFLLNPGIRWAYNLRNGLQIVPGVGVPLGVGPSAGERGVFLYLSIEHPFRKLPKT